MIYLLVIIAFNEGSDQCYIVCGLYVFNVKTKFGSIL